MAFSQESINSGQNVDKDSNSINLDNLDSPKFEIKSNATEELERETKINFDVIPENEELSITSIGFLDVLRIIFVLSLIIAIAYVVIWILKRIQNKSLVNSNTIEVLSTQSLQQGNMLYIVKTGASYFLLGSTSQTVTSLKEFSKREEKDELLISLSVSASSSLNERKSSFIALLRSFGGLFSKVFTQGKKRDKNSMFQKTDIERGLSSLRDNAKRSKDLNGK